MMKKVLYALLVACAATVAPGEASQQIPNPLAPAFPQATNEPINIRFEIKISEEGGDQKPTTKTVSMIGSLTEVSSVRASGGYAGTHPLNVDVFPTVLQGGRIRTRVSIEYKPILSVPQNKAAEEFIIRQQVHVWLDAGKPLVVSQSVDPASDRRVTFEVTATIMK